MRKIMIAGAVMASITMAGAASAQTPEAFYKGKTVSIVMGTGPGGSYDLYGRLLINQYGKHLPGNPNFIIEHMPGAGGATVKLPRSGGMSGEDDAVTYAHTPCSGGEKRVRHSPRVPLPSSPS